MEGFPFGNSWRCLARIAGSGLFHAASIAARISRVTSLTEIPYCAAIFSKRLSPHISVGILDWNTINRSVGFIPVATRRLLEHLARIGTELTITLPLLMAGHTIMVGIPPCSLIWQMNTTKGSSTQIIRMTRFKEWR